MLSGGGCESDKFWMRVLFCKIHCPSFLCFCKPSPHIYTSGLLKLENTPNVPPKLVSVPPETSDQCPADNKVEIFDEQQQQQLPQNSIKSNLKKPNSDSTEQLKKTVQWMDLLGKELVEIREFESSEIEDSNYEVEDMNRSCICVIL